MPLGRYLAFARMTFRDDAIDIFRKTTMTLESKLNELEREYIKLVETVPTTLYDPQQAELPSLEELKLLSKKLFDWGFAAGCLSMVRFVQTASDDNLDKTEALEFAIDEFPNW